MSKQRETRERVLELIEALGVGDAIPSERQLGVDLSVSRLTVRAESGSGRVPFEADGEFAGEAPVELSIAAKKLRVIVA